MDWLNLVGNRPELAIPDDVVAYILFDRCAVRESEAWIVTTDLEDAIDVQVASGEVAAFDRVEDLDLRKPDVFSALLEARRPDQVVAGTFNNESSELAEYDSTMQVLALRKEGVARHYDFVRLPV